MPRAGFYIVMGGLVACAGIAMCGRQEASVNLSSVLELWRDALRDADQTALRMTRVSDAEEVNIGNQEAAMIGGWEEQTVTAIGQKLTPYLRRRGIPYRFRVLESPEMNAFALPGGNVFVLRGMLNFVQSDDELAALLGHEMSHVDLRHCIEQYQYGPLAEVLHRVVTQAFNGQQELEADAQGARMAMAAGYDPAAAAQLMRRLEIALRERPPHAADTPAGELGYAVFDALTDYFRTHPHSAERAAALDRLAARRKGI